MYDCTLISTHCRSLPPYDHYHLLENHRCGHSLCLRQEVTMSWCGIQPAKDYIFLNYLCCFKRVVKMRMNRFSRVLFGRFYGTANIPNKESSKGGAPFDFFAGGLYRLFYLFWATFYIDHSFVTK